MVETEEVLAKEVFLKAIMGENIGSEPLRFAVNVLTKMPKSRARALQMVEEFETFQPSSELDEGDQALLLSISDKLFNR